MCALIYFTWTRPTEPAPGGPTLLVRPTKCTVTTAKLAIKTSTSTWRLPSPAEPGPDTPTAVCWTPDQCVKCQDDHLLQGSVCHPKLDRVEHCTQYSGSLYKNYTQGFVLKSHTCVQDQCQEVDIHGHCTECEQGYFLREQGESEYSTSADGPETLAPKQLLQALPK